MGHRRLRSRSGDRRHGHLRPRCARQRATRPSEAAHRARLLAAAARRELILVGADIDDRLPVAVAIADAQEMARLPALHKDPFDPILIAQAEVEGAMLLTSDDPVAQYASDSIRRV